MTPGNCLLTVHPRASPVSHHIVIRRLPAAAQTVGARHFHHLVVALLVCIAQRLRLIVFPWKFREGAVFQQELTHVHVDKPANFVPETFIDIQIEIIFDWKLDSRASVAKLAIPKLKI